MNHPKPYHFLKAWKKASIELGISITHPFKLNIGNELISFDLLINDFGHKNGTIILPLEKFNLLSQLQSIDYYISCMNYDNYSAYNRQIFIDALNDWRYYGNPANIPEWYSGKAWTR